MLDPSAGPMLVRTGSFGSPVHGGPRRAPANLKRRNSLVHLNVARRVFLTTDDGEKQSIGELIDKIGFGSYQVQVFVLAFGALMVESSMISMVAALVTPISEDLHIESSLGHASFTGLVYLGIQLGTLATGCLADYYGRRYPLFFGLVGMLAFSLTAPLATSAEALYVFLFFIGVWGGICVPSAMISISEIMPGALRGTASAALGLGFRFGWLWSAIGLRILMPDLTSGPWRWLLVWAAIPALTFLVAGLLCSAARQDTPHFLAVSGQDRSLVSTINLMAEMNGRPELRLIRPDDLQCEKRATSVTCGQVVGMATSHPLRLYILIMVVLFFAKEFTAAGTVAYWPEVFSHRHQQDFISEIQGQRLHEQSRMTSSFVPFFLDLGLGTYTMTPATELCITALISFPGIAVAMAAMHLLRRRLALAAGAVLTGLGALLLLCLYTSRPNWGLVGISLMQLFFPIWQMVTMLLGSEIFPTQIRGMAFSATFFVGRFGSVVAQFSVHSSRVAFPISVACFAVVAIALVQWLPETKDVELTNHCSPSADGGSPSSGSYGSTEHGLHGRS